MSRLQVVAIISAVFLLGVVLELVRRRRLREEYSFLWLGSVGLYFIFALFPDLSIWFAKLIGTSNTTAAFIFFGLLFLILLLIQYSIRLSSLTDRVKDLAQLIAIMDSEHQKLEQQLEDVLNQRVDEERY